MRILARAALAAVCFAASVSAAVAQNADDKTYTAGTIKIVAPWTRVPPPAATVGGGFMTITNTGTAPDTLIGGTAVVSKKFEVHEMKMDGGVMRMRELKPGLVIKPGETVALKPGGYHVMFIDITSKIEMGKPVKGTLVFEKAGTVEIEYKVEAMGARGSGAGSGHGGGSKAH